MKCAWQELLSVLPLWMRQSVDTQGRLHAQELRLRLGQAPELCFGQKSVWLEKPVLEEDLSFVVNMASRYSPWAASTVSRGYLTAKGGHRIGICGDAVVSEGKLAGIRQPTALCIRIARDFPGIADRATGITGSVLILGAPGSGKTTLLRDLIRQRSRKGPGSVAVVDERGELFPPGCFEPGSRTDVLSGCSKQEGIDLVLRCMGPGCIAVDEITAEGDCQALERALWCGVDLIATAHASDKRDLLSRNIYRTLVQSRLFTTVLVMAKDKSWRAERMEL